MLKKIVLVIIAIILVAGGIHLVKKKKAAIRNLPLPEKRVVAVQTTTAEAGSFAGVKLRLGNLEAKQAARLAARVTGRIIEIQVREGDRVEAGQILVRLDDRREKDRVAALKADLGAARTRFQTDAAIYARDRKLFKAKAISREALDRSKSRHDDARARVTSLEQALATARTELSYTLIKAPAAGLITARLADPGELATPGKALLGFENEAAGFFIRVNLPQAELSRYRVGGPVRLRPDREASLLAAAKKAPEALSAAISRLHPAVGKNDLAALEIDLPRRPFDLPTGSELFVELRENQVKGFRLPARAVLENVDKNWVYTVDAKNRIHLVEVSIRSRGDGWFVVDGELGDHPRVVVAQESALLRLHEKMPVRVVK